MRIEIIQKIIDKLRMKNKLKLFADKDNTLKLPKNLKGSITIQGKNNSVEINTENITGSFVLNICGDNNQIYIDKNVSSNIFLNIEIGQNHKNFGKVKNCKFKIMENTSIGSLKYQTYNSGTFCEIGKNCMISYGVEIYNTDGHPIFDKETGEIINYVDGIKIGDHCWLGGYSTVLKNSIMPDNCILGYKAVFSGKKNIEPNCAFAGNPAKCVRKNINWDSNSNKYGYIDNIKK